MLAFLSLLLVPVALAEPPTVLPRSGSSRFTNYYAGDSEGACGAWHQDSEYVVALPKVQWDGGSHCNQEVYITYNGMSATAKIVDECEECPYGALDFSQSLFGHFVGGEQNNLNVGEFYGTYVFGSSPSSGGDDDDDTTTTKKPKPTTTTHKTASTHSTATAHTTATTTHTSANHSASASVAQSVAPTSSSSGASVSTSATPVTGSSPQNIEDFSRVILNLAALVMQGPDAA